MEAPHAEPRAEGPPGRQLEALLADRFAPGGNRGAWVGQVPLTASHSVTRSVWPKHIHASAQSGGAPGELLRKVKCWTRFDLCFAS